MDPKMVNVKLSYSRLLISPVVVIALLLGTVAHAEPVENAPKTFVINRENVRDRILNNGLTVMAAQNRLRRAKLSVDASRGRLFPSINLGVVAGTLANPSFVLASVEYVLPFLIPQRWFDLKKAKYIQQAEKHAFFATEVNIFASAYSLVLNVQNDFRTRNMIIEDLRDAVQIEDLVTRNLEEGRATESDLSRSKSQSATVQIRLARINELLVEEVAQLKQIFNLPQETTLIFESLTLSNPNIEKTPADLLAKEAIRVSPEKQQVNNLVESAKLEKKSKFFSFISGVTAGNSIRGVLPGEQASFAFSRQTFRGGLNFGLDYFPNLDIAETQIEDLRLRQQEINGEMEKAIFSLVGRYQYVLKRLQEATIAEELLTQVFENDQYRYENGEVQLIQVFDSQAKMRQMATERLRAETDVQLLWLSAHRMLLSDDFSKIQGCESLPKNETARRRFPWGRRDEPSVCDAKSTNLKFSGEYQEP